MEVTETGLTENRKSTPVGVQSVIGPHRRSATWAGKSIANDRNQERSSLPRLNEVCAYYGIGLRSRLVCRCSPVAMLPRLRSRTDGLNDTL